MAERVLPIDEVFFNLDTETTHQQIASLVVLDRAPDMLRFPQDVSRTVEAFPRMRQRLQRGRRPVWVEAERFSPAEHIRTFDAGGRPLLEAASEVYTEPLDLARPLWRFTVITNAAGGESAVFFGLHHAMSDGVGGLEWVRTHFSDGPAAPAAGMRGGSRERKDSSSKLPSAFTRRRLGSLLHWLVDFVKFSVRGPLNGVNSSRRRLHAASIPVEALRRIKTRAGTTKNDVIFGIVAGAVRSYCEQHRRPLERVQVVMPVSLRNVSERFLLGNRLTGVSVPLTITGSTPLARLQDAHAVLTEFKQSGVIGAYASLARALSRLPAGLMRRMSEIQARRTNFILTNMSGEKRERWLAGARIVANYGIPALMRGHGVGFGFISYAGELCCIVVSDPSIVPDGETLAQLVEQEASLMLESVDGANRRARA